MKIKNYLFVIPFVLLTACSSEVEQIEVQGLEIVEVDKIDLKSQISVDKTTDLVSNLFYKIGVDNIEVEKNMTSKGDAKTTFKIKTKKGFYLNSEYIPIYDYVFTIEDNFLIRIDKPNKGVSLANNRLVINDNNHIYYADSNFDVIDENDFTILIILLSEIITPSQNKSSSIQNGVTSRYWEFPDCNFWNTYYEMFSVATRSAAMYRAEKGAVMIDDLIDYSNSSCMLKGMDTYCEFGDFLCVTVLTYCCPDGEGFPY